MDGGQVPAGAVQFQNAVFVQVTVQRKLVDARARHEVLAALGAFVAVVVCRAAGRRAEVQYPAVRGVADQQEAGQLGPVRVVGVFFAVQPVILVPVAEDVEHVARDGRGRTGQAAPGGGDRPPAVQGDLVQRRLRGAQPWAQKGHLRIRRPQVEDVENPPGIGHLDVVVQLHVQRRRAHIEPEVGRAGYPHVLAQQVQMVDDAMFVQLHQEFARAVRGAVVHHREP